MRFQIYPDRGGKWRWRIKRNGRITACSGESFASKSNAKRALCKFAKAMWINGEDLGIWIYPELIEVVKK